MYVSYVTKKLIDDTLFEHETFVSLFVRHYLEKKCLVKTSIHKTPFENVIKKTNKVFRKNILQCLNTSYCIIFTYDVQLFDHVKHIWH